VVELSPHEEIVQQEEARGDQNDAQPSDEGDGRISGAVRVEERGAGIQRQGVVGGIVAEQLGRVQRDLFAEPVVAGVM